MKRKLPVSTIDDDIIAFVEDVQAVSPTHRRWKGYGVAATRMQMVATESQREEVNGIGALHGCHSCLTMVDTDKNQPWIGDHQPPTELSARARTALGLPGEVYDGTVKLRPQCDVCSVSQAGTVKRINTEVAGGAAPNLNALGNRLLGVTAPLHRRCIDASSARVSAPEGLAIQRLGEAHGCHSCKSLYPKDAYHADHCPAVCYTFSHVVAILQHARDNVTGCRKIAVGQNFELRPQCPRCSHEQGGKMNELHKRSTRLAKRLGIPVLRD